jgi:uncharacterized protein
VITALIKNGADVNARDEQGVTALMYAAENNQNLEVAKALISAGADVNARGEKGVTALMEAAKKNTNPKVIKTLIENGAEISDKDELLNFLEENENIEKNQDYWDLRDTIYNKMK